MQIGGYRADFTAHASIASAIASPRCGNATAPVWATIGSGQGAQIVFTDSERTLDDLPPVRPRIMLVPKSRDLGLGALKFRHCLDHCRVFVAGLGPVEGIAPQVPQPSFRPLQVDKASVRALIEASIAALRSSVKSRSANIRVVQLSATDRPHRPPSRS